MRLRLGHVRILPHDNVNAITRSHCRSRFRFAIEVMLWIRVSAQNLSGRRRTYVRYRRSASATTPPRSCSKLIVVAYCQLVTACTALSTPLSIRAVAQLLGGTARTRCRTPVWSVDERITGARSAIHASVAMLGDDSNRSLLTEGSWRIATHRSTSKVHHSLSQPAV